MAKILAVGDIHNHITQASVIIDKYIDTHKIVLCGDFFDDFGDSAVEADQTARWLKDILKHDNVVALMGNHDLSYAYFNLRPGSSLGDQIYDCSGYSPAKDDAINRIMSNDDWDKIKFGHKENGFWFSHAGFHPFWFSSPPYGMDDQIIEIKLKKIQRAVQDREFSNELGAAGKCRGGMNRVGGLLWRDQRQESYTGSYWNDESGIKQVSGHTPMRNGIDIEETSNKGLCIDIDCGLSQVLEILEDSTYNIIDTGLESFYKASERKFDEQLKKEKEEQKKKYLHSLGAYDDIYNKLNKS
ncbi:MPP_superfamily domain containing protein [uncultured Caudovirales phage]|uniref:MPP_superfamily domain containing protein n=1 Tax=uncultured Caudovirales phage TaxID=2100421 RepID=A0A6J7XEH4_9CAUD|nr:MPP_superfamily domain containing protein [uncultured Caudovirales phage]